MADNPMYWSDQHGWYQPMGPPQNHQPPPPTSYQTASSYQAAGPQASISHVSTSPPTQQQMIPNGSSNGNHLNHMQSATPSQAPPNQPTSNLNHYNHQPNPNMHHEHPPPPSAVQQQMQSTHLDSSSAYTMQQQSYAQSRPQPQQHPPHQQPPMYAQPNQPGPDSSSYSMATQSNQNSQHGSSNQGPSLMPSMQQPNQQQQQPIYPQQQYSPAPYWNSGPPPMQNYQQSMYGSSQGGPQSLAQPQAMHHQGPMPTPPSSIPENPSGYHSGTGTNPPGQPPSQSQQPPQPSSMPYDSRGTNISANYSTTYQQQTAPGYYSPHEVHQHLPPQAPQIAESYEQHQMSHQQPPPPPPQDSHPQWSNGYYQPNNSPYPGTPVNPYSSVPTYNGNQSNNIPPQQNSHMQGMHPNQIPPPSMPPHLPQHQQHLNQTHNHHGPPPNYAGHPPHQQHMALSQSQWPQQQQQQQSQQNHNIPIIDRNNKSVQEKKPVKARAPKKQSNPNAPTGRRKRPFMTEEHKQSGYAKFFQIKQKELKEPDFGQLSKIISDLWARLSDQERSAYVKDVSIKRKEMLKKKASQQAQDLLVHGVTQEQDVLLQGVKKE